MLDDPEDMLGACLKKLGLPFSATDPAQLRRAEQEAIAQKPLLRAYLNAEVRDQLVAGDVLAAQLWSTTAQQAIDAAPQLAFVYPAEGFPLVLRLRRHPARKPPRAPGASVPGLPAAPASLRQIVEATRTATANAAALDAAARSPSAAIRVSIRPPEVFDRGEWPRTLAPATQRLRDRIWTEIKSA